MDQEGGGGKTHFKPGDLPIRKHRHPRSVMPSYSICQRAHSLRRRGIRGREQFCVRPNESLCLRLDACRHGSSMETARTVFSLDLKFRVMLSHWQKFKTFKCKRKKDRVPSFIQRCIETPRRADPTNTSPLSLPPLHSYNSHSDFEETPSSSILKSTLQDINTASSRRSQLTI